MPRWPSMAVSKVTACPHTDRKHCAKGLCGACYQRQLGGWGPQTKPKRRLTPADVLATVGECQHEAPRKHGNFPCKLCYAKTYNSLKDVRQKNAAGYQKSKVIPEWQDHKRSAQWRYDLRTKYNMTPEDFYNLLRKQGGVCAICLTASTKHKKAKVLAVDHCHATEKVRGLLCDKCNNGIARFDDSVELLQRAIRYLTPVMELTHGAGI